LCAYWKSSACEHWTGESKHLLINLVDEEEIRPKVAFSEALPIANQSVIPQTLVKRLAA
jgi:hypothetical protein